jgi:hypothetical protein
LVFIYHIIAPIWDINDDFEPIEQPRGSPKWVFIYHIINPIWDINADLAPFDQPLGVPKPRPGHSLNRSLYTI